MTEIPQNPIRPPTVKDSKSTAPRVLDHEPDVTSAVPWRTGVQRPGLSTLGLSALFGVSLAVAGAGYLLDIGALRLAGVLGALFFGVGTAPLQLSERPGLAMRLGVAGVMGLSVSLLVGTVMVLVPIWQPLLAAVILGGAAVGVHAQGCRRALPALRSLGSFRSLGRRWRPALDGSSACTLGGTVLWWVAALGLGHVVPGVGGFLPDISPLWYAGLVLLLGAIVLARGKSEAHAMFALVSLVAALTLTPAMAYGTPRSLAAAKHVDLVQLILRAHHLDPRSGIYEAYSGFFSAVAWVDDLARVHATIGLAAYWPFFIGLVGLAELRFLFGRVTSSRYRIWVCMTLVVLVNAIGADYFSPQSVGFVLALGIYGLALEPGWPDLGDRMRIALLTLAGCSIAVTHELSPFIAGGVLVVLVIFRAARPWYMPAACIVPAILWAMLNWQEVERYGTNGHIGSLSNFVPPKTISTLGLQRLPIVGESSHALLLGLLVLIVLAGVGFVRTMRHESARKAPTWGFLICAGMGLIAITFNSYGNEGIFRAALFGIPWLAVLAMQAVPGNPPLWVSAAFGAVAVGLLGTFLIAMFGLDNVYVIRPADFEAYQAYEAQAPASSFILDLSYGDLPDSVTFPLPGHSVGWASVVTPASLGPGQLDAADASALARRYISYAAGDGASARELYAIWSPSSAEYSVDYGLETLAQAQKWRELLAASPDWQVVFHRDGTYLYRVVPPS
jgi:hypothetical protein